MNGKVLKINVKDVIGGDVAMSTEDGVKVFNVIKKAFENKASVALDFKNIDLLTSAFLNAAIGQLYAHYDSEFLNKNLNISEIESADLETLKLVIDRAKSFFDDEEETSKAIDKELDDDK